MKISSASKKVLASALSAAMVVAFAPTVALAADTASLTEDQAKALGYTVKSVQVVTGTSGSEVKTFYYKDLNAAFESGAVSGGSHAAVNLGLTLMADQDGEFVTDDDAADTISIDTNGFKITNSKEEDKAPLTISANDTVTVTGTGSIEQVKGDAADGTAAGVKAVQGDGSAVLKGVTVTTASKKTSAVTTASTELEGATIEGAVQGVTKVKDGTYGTIKAKASTTIDVYGTVASKGIEGSVKAYAGADLSVEATNSKDGKSATGIAGNVEFATLSTGKTASVKVSATNTGSTVDGTLDAVTAGSEFDKNATYVTLAGTTPTKYQISGSDVTSSNFDATTMVAAGVYAFTAGKSADATAISGAVSGVAEGVTLEAAAKATGYDASSAVKGITGDANIDPTTDAKAIGSVSGNIEKGALAASATSVDGTATGVGSALTVKGGTVAVSSEGADADKSVAVKGDLTASAGKYTGKYGSGSSFTGGSYSVKPGTGNYNSASYVVVDDGEFFNVEQAKNFKVAKTSAYNKNVAADSADDKAILAFAENLLQDISAGKTVSGIALAKDVKEADLVSKAVAGDLKIDYKVSAYNAKRATDGQKAAYEALKKYATDNLSLIENADDCTVAFYELSLGYNDKSGSYVKMADVKDLGTKVDGRDTVANTITLRSVNDATAGTVISYSGSVAKMAYAVKDGKTQNYVETAAIPFATAFMTTDLNAVKDAAIKGSDEPAAEKATQGIDVAKKSKTVKLAKKATKTKKAASFNMGVSAETAVTTAKKSGSSKITVKGGKVTLKKGVKKGTYTAKVTVKAAASDAYLAAAKTVTVKFVVKK